MGTKDTDVHTYVHTKDSQKIKIKKRQRFPGSLIKGGIPRNSCLTQWSRRRKKRKTPGPVSLFKALSRFPYRLFYRVGIACRKKIFHTYTYVHT